MYNDPMPTRTFEIRLCIACGLRYPLTEGQVFGTRCPVCLGETRLLLSRQLIFEPNPIGPLGTRSKSERSAEVAITDSDFRSRDGLGGVAVLLDNIRSAWNVGSILRSADGFGFAHAYLCGITPTPEHEAVAKTSLGAQESVEWSYHKDAVKLVNGLMRDGWRIWALEDDERAQPIQEAVPGNTRQPVALVLGNEVTGVDPALLDLCDEIFYIPMRGEKKSFNVAMAFSIAAYQLQK
jgi:tRNA G18 (ribose-2'-O)-methylase SpoU